MTPEQALHIVDQHLALLNVNRQTHNTILNAISVLNSLVIKAKLEKKPTNEKAEKAEETKTE